MESFPLLFMLLLFLIKLVQTHGNKLFTYKSSSPIDKTPEPPRADFITSAISEFIKRGSDDEYTLQDAKYLLRDLRVPAENIDFIVETAQKVYKVLEDEDQGVNIKIEGGLSNKIIPPDAINVCLKPGGVFAAFFVALMGKDTYQVESTKELIYMMAIYAGFLPPVIYDDKVQICQTVFEGFGGKKHAVQLRSIKINGQLESFFPYLATQTVISFTVNRVSEYETNKEFNAQAKISGTIADKTALNFFATDYAVNKAKYIVDAPINIHVSAFALEAYWFKTENERLWASKAPGIALVPNESGKGCLYDFTGYLLSAKAAPVSLKPTGCMVSIKLYDGDEAECIDVFVNTENITSGQMKRNIMVKGTLWLQGEIAI